MLDMIDPPYRLARCLCGLSIDEAAAFHGVDRDTIMAWDAGDAIAAPDAWATLSNLFMQIMEASSKAAVRMAGEGLNGDFYFATPTADLEADPLPEDGSRRAAGVIALLTAMSMSSDDALIRAEAGTSCA